MSKEIRQPAKRNEDINFNRIQYEVARSITKGFNLRNKDILDFGAGNGEWASLIRGYGNSVDCFEPNKDSRKALKSFGLNIIEKLEKKYDYIFMLDVIEHIVEPEKILEMLSKHLKENGRIVITTPDCNYWKYKIKHLLGDCSLFAYPHKHFVFFIDKNLKELCDKYFETMRLGRYPYTLGYVGMKK